MNKTPFEKAGDFLLGRGFYIVLFLCVATIGFSGYYLISSLSPSASGDTIAPVAASPEITIPDPLPVVTPAEVPILNEVEETSEETIIEPTETIQPIQSEIEVAVAPTEIAEEVTAPAAMTTTVYTWPLKGEILREFSMEALSWDVTMGDWRTHDGIDIAATLGTSVCAPGRGTVEAVYEDDLMGYTVVIAHPDGIVSTLSNLTSVMVVSQGDSVEPGQVIGALGETAVAEQSLPAHLHLSMEQDGVPIDPLTVLP